MLYVLTFTNLYFTTSQANRGCFSETLGKADAVYLTMTFLTATDFGEIRAIEDACRALVAAEIPS